MELCRTRVSLYVLRHSPRSLIGASCSRLVSCEQEECQLTFACLFKRQVKEPSWVLGEEFAKRRRVPTLPKPFSGGRKERFPDDFFFELTKEGQRMLRSQSGTLKRGEHSKYRAYAFTEQGVAMLSGVLRGSRAVQVNIASMRAFVRLREIIGSTKVLARRLAELEKKYDAQFRVVFDAIRELMEEPKPKSRRIGFRT